MASYPDAVKSFTTKNPGQSIASAHVNDLQDEVNAIEAGLLNGTARVNSSGLSVTGPSTFASRPMTPPPDAVRVFRTSTMAASSNLSTIAFNQQSYITNSSMHSTTTNPEQLTPQSTGLYHVTAAVATSSNSTGYRQLFLLDSSGANFGRAVSYAAVGSSDVGAFFQVTGTKRFDVLGGYVSVEFQNVGASTLSLIANESWATMHKL